MLVLLNKYRRALYDIATETVAETGVRYAHQGHLHGAAGQVELPR